MKYIVNKCDENGNIITGYQEVLNGSKEEVERDYRNHHEYTGPIDIQRDQQSRFVKANGFPTSYGYACGYGKRTMNDGDDISLFEDDSHKQIDVIIYIGHKRVAWETFSYFDYPRHVSQRLAEKFFTEKSKEYKLK